jgi:hypothetical protein|eukprot:COSAG02_NODE_9718_length_2133_cov_3.347099_2_plen_63_part_00
MHVPRLKLVYWLTLGDKNAGGRWRHCWEMGQQLAYTTLFSHTSPMAPLVRIVRNVADQRPGL